MNTNFDMSARIEFNSQIRKVESASLSDRHEGRDSWTDAITTDPKMIADRIGWV